MYTHIFLSITTIWTALSIYNCSFDNLYVTRNIIKIIRLAKNKKKDASHNCENSHLTNFLL